MSLDLIALAIVLAFVGLGAVRGAVATGGSLFALAAGYAAGIFAGSAWGADLAAFTALPVLMGGAVAGTLGFVVVYAAVGLAWGWLRRWDRVAHAGVPRGPVDRGLGASFGAIRGGFVVLLLAWLALWMDAGRELSGGTQFQSAPDPSGSHVARATSEAVEYAVTAALGDEGRGTRVAARMVSRPRVAIGGLQSLLDDERLQAIQHDEFFWTLVENGAASRAVHRGSFVRITNDDALRRRLADLGIISGAAADDAATFRRDAAAALDEIGPRLAGLADDPAIRVLAEDPAVQQMIEAGDTLGLLGHDGVREVAARIGAEL